MGINEWKDGYQVPWAEDYKQVAGLEQGTIMIGVACVTSVVQGSCSGQSGVCAKSHAYPESP